MSEAKPKTEIKGMLEAAWCIRGSTDAQNGDSLK